MLYISQIHYFLKNKFIPLLRDYDFLSEDLRKIVVYEFTFLFYFYLKASNSRDSSYKQKIPPYTTFSMFTTKLYRKNGYS